MSEQQVLHGKQAQPVANEKNEDIWTSAYDSERTPVAPPPTAQLSADPSSDGSGQGEDGEYQPETVVFEIGGFADPQDPAKGDGGKGIKVVMPPGLDQHAALVNAVMAMLRCTESEAQIAIEREHIVWTNYRPEGHGTDREGNIIHLIRYQQKYVERVAHEPQSLRPTEGDGLLAYKQFKVYLLDHEDDNIRDPYEQYDRMAREQGWYVSEPPFTIEEDEWNDRRRDYEKQRQELVEFVIWERLRAKREKLAAGIGEESTSAKLLVEAMADRLPSIIDLDEMQRYVPPKYFQAWFRLHAGVISAQAALEAGDTQAIRHGGLGGQIFQLAYWFADFVQGSLGKKRPDGTQLYAAFGVPEVAEVARLNKTDQPTIEDGFHLLALHYKLTFALMEAAGRLMAVRNEQSFLNPGGNEELNQKGREIEAQGKAGSAVLEMLAEHPSAQRVNAKFYPEAQTKDFRQGGDMSQDDWTRGMEIDLFLYHDAEAGEWVLEDFTNLDQPKSNRARGAADAPVPAALFARLNTKLRFPRGALFYRVPGEGSYRILRTTAPTSPGEWLRWVAMAGLAVGMAAMTMGAGIPAEIILAGSAVGMAGAEVAAINEEHQQGMLTRESIFVHSALIASCVLGGASASLKILAQVGLATRAGMVARVVSGLQVGADSLCVAVFTQEAFEGLHATAHDPEGPTFTRLLGFLLQLGMNGLMLYGMKGSMAEAAGAKSLTGEGAALKRQLAEEGNDVAANESEIAKGEELIDGMALQEMHREAKMSTGAKIGVAATPESIKVGTVRMEDHPNYARKLEEVREKGFEIVFEKRLDPRVEVKEIVDMKGNLLRVERKLFLGENMQYLDLEHELGHIYQLEHLASNESGITATVRNAEKPIANGKVKLIHAPNQDGVLDSALNKVTELHNRLVEFNRLFENGAENALLFEHAKGVASWRSDLQKVISMEKRTYKTSNIEKWALRHFEDMYELDRKFYDIITSKGFKLSEGTTRHNPVRS